MRYITHYRVERKIELSNGPIFCLTIENALLYRQMIESLREGGDDCYFKLHDSDKTSNLMDRAIFIDDLLSPMPEDKKVNTFIEKDLTVSIDDDVKIKLSEITQQLSEVIRSVIVNYPVSIDISSDISVQSLLKTFSVHPIVYGETYIESLILQLRVLSLLNKKYLFVLLNLFDYLDQDEYRQFVREMRNLEYDFFVLSSHIPAYEAEDLTIIRIDQDLAELHVEYGIDKE